MSVVSGPDGMHNRPLVSEAFSNYLQTHSAASAAPENPFEQGLDAHIPGSTFLAVDQYLAKERDPVAAHPDALRYLGGAALLMSDTRAAFAGFMGAHSLVSSALQAKQSTLLHETRVHLSLWGADPRTEKFIGTAGLTPDDKDHLTAGGTRTLLDGLVRLDDKALLVVLAARRDALRPRIALQELRMEQHTLDFKNRLEYAATRQRLPVDVAMAHRKVDATMILSADPLNLKPMQDAAYTPHYRAARVGLHLGLEDDPLQEAVDHELVHAIGGISCTDNPLDQSLVCIRRTGLKVLDHDTSWFDWLNEPVTERLSWMLRRKDIDYGAMSLHEMASCVRVQRYVYQDIFANSLLLGPGGEVPFHTVLAAFFEDYDPVQPVGARSPLQRQLHNSIGAVWNGFENVRAFVYDRFVQKSVDNDRPSTLFNNPYVLATHGLAQRRQALQR